MMEISHSHAHIGPLRVGRHWVKLTGNWLPVQKCRKTVWAVSPGASSSRMMRRMNHLESLSGYVGINGCAGNISMPQ